MEEWKDIIWFEWLYEISSKGRVKGLWKKHWFLLKKEFILKQSYSNQYRVISLSKQKKRTYHYLHRLVAIHFVFNLENKKQVNHKDWDVENNNKWNLEWMTAQENIQHSYKVLWRLSSHFGKLWAKYNPTSKWVKQYTLEWIFIKEWESISTICRELWKTHSNITACCTNKQHHAYWYKWIFANKWK